MLNIAMWVGALATCAIEDNQWAKETLEMRTKNPEEFLHRVQQMELDWLEEQK